MIVIGMLLLALVAALVTLVTTLPGGGRSGPAGPPRSRHNDYSPWQLEAR